MISQHYIHNTAAAYVGIPYLVGGTNPSIGLDCWGLVFNFLKEININIPVSYDKFIRSKSNITKQLEPETKDTSTWKKLDKPENLCIVVFTRKTYAIHVGVYIDGENKVLHATGQHGVVFEDLQTIKYKRGLSPTFYKWQK